MLSWLNLKNLALKGIVIKMISEDQKKVEKHAVDMKGIMKTYVVSSDTTVKTLLDNLSKGVIHD